MMTTIDIWGKIELDKNFELIVNSKEFKDIKDKTQLGLDSNPKCYSYEISTQYWRLCIGMQTYRYL